MNETPLHIQQAEGLEKLAAMIRANPEVAEYASLGHLYAFHVRSAEAHATMIRAALSVGATIEKSVSDTLYNVVLHWGPVGAYVIASRDEVCQRVQVGTETVTRKEQDPDAVEAALADIPVVEVTEVVPVYQWECRPLLASMKDGE